MPLVTNLNSLVTRLATEFKTISGRIGTLTSLTTTEKSSLVGAINEIRAGQAQAGAQINDTTPGAATVYSSSKTESRISEAVTGLVNAAPAALDTLKELSDALGGDAAFATTVNTALSNRVRYDAAQTLTAPQQTQARANIGAGTSSLVIGTSAGQAKDGAWREVDASTTAKGLVQLAGMLGGTATSPTVRSATTALTGAVQLATTTETSALTDANKAITPAALKPLADSKANATDVGNTETDFVAAFNTAIA